MDYEGPNEVADDLARAFADALQPELRRDPPPSVGRRPTRREWVLILHRSARWIGDVYVVLWEIETERGDEGMAAAERKHEPDSTQRPNPMPPSRIVGADALPELICEYSGLDRIDFADQVSVSGVPRRSAEEWARATIGRVPLLPRVLIWQVVLRGRLDHRRSPDLIGGWRVAHRDEHRIRLETTSPAMSVRLMVTTDDDRVSLTTCVRFDTRRGKALWKAIEPLHGFGDPQLLASAARKESDLERLQAGRDDGVGTAR